MAVRKTKAEEENIEITNSNEETLKSENEELKEKLNKLEAMFTAFMETQKSIPVETKSETKKELTFGAEDMYQPIEEKLDIRPHDMIKVISFTQGQLILKGVMGKIISLPEFGSSSTISYEDICAINNNHRQLVRNGAFFIQDKRVVKSLNLEREYSKFVSIQWIEDMMSLDEYEIEKVFKESPKMVKESALKILIDKFAKGEHLDRNKLEVIAKVTGYDVTKISNDDLQTYRAMTSI